jgi:phage repressor protein C with HTH and peptisase S24 domain
MMYFLRQYALYCLVEYLLAMDSLEQDLTTPDGRLRWARQRKYAQATYAAAAMGVKPATYTHHENGTRGYRKQLWKYSSFFRVSAEWLDTGRGDPLLRRETVPIPIYGEVGAGAVVNSATEERLIAEHDAVSLPDDGNLGALVVRGDSQEPRWYEGEVVIYDVRGAPLDQLVQRYCVVADVDGNRWLKWLHRHLNNDSWMIGSHNVREMQVLRLIGGFPIVATLHRTPGASTSKRALTA